jgi:hypothetical protein
MGFLALRLDALLLLACMTLLRRVRQQYRECARTKFDLNYHHVYALCGAFGYENVKIIKAPTAPLKALELNG